uniref:Bidirectional sugar transporter SWEET n=1 Tax=Aegilops tauschii TaxID=37682 RepID=N1QXA2_AEGTA
MDMDVFAWICYGTAFAAAVMNMTATVSAWKAWALGGQGVRFPDPIVAAVLGNAAWLTYGWLSGSNEALWLNVFCGFIQLVYLTTFLILCTENERRTALKRIALALLYLAVVVGSRLAPAHGDTEELRKQEEFHKLLCTLAGAAAPVTPLFIAFYYRIMNVIGAVCSCISLVLIRVLNQQPEVPDDDNDDGGDDDDNYDGDDDDNYDGDDDDNYDGDGDDDDETNKEIRERLARLRLIDSEPEEEIESEEEVDPTVQALDETVHQ